MNRSNAKNRILGALTLTLGLAAFAPAQVPASEDIKRSNETSIAQSMGITQNLGKFVPLNLKFKDESGKTIEFREVLHDRPVVVVPIFYRCQTACSIITDRVMKTLAKAWRTDKLVVGRDLDIVMVSLHPQETPELARSKKQLILNALKPPPSYAEAEGAWRERMDANWRLLTGDEQNVRALVTDALGVKYKYDAAKNLINHPTGTVFLTPEGEISSYTIGNEFPTVIVENQLATAAKHQVGDRADQSMMFGCIMLDPETMRYRPVVQRILQVAGAFTILAMAGFIVTMNIQTKRKNPLGGGDQGVR
jgi:protein SCO1/2